MPPRGAAIRAEQLATVGRIAHTKFTSPEIGTLLDDLRGWGEQHDYDSFEASLIRVARARLGEGAPGAARAARRDVALRRAREPGLGRGAQGRTTSRRSCPSCARTSICASATSTASRSKRRAVRHRARRLRARHDDEGGAAHLRLPEGAPGAARQGGRRRAAATTRSRASTFALDAQKTFELEVVQRVRLHRRRVAARPDRASVRVRHRHHRHPHHDALLHRPPRRPLRDDARVRPRALRAPGRPGARAQRRSRAASRSACTSRRAGCGRTSSAARCRSGATSSRGCRSSSRRARRRRRRALVPRGERASSRR